MTERLRSFPPRIRTSISEVERIRFKYSMGLTREDYRKMGIRDPLFDYRERILELDCERYNFMDKHSLQFKKRFFEGCEGCSNLLAADHSIQSFQCIDCLKTDLHVNYNRPPKFCKICKNLAARYPLLSVPLKTRTFWSKKKKRFIFMDFLKIFL